MSHALAHGTPDACFPNNWFSTHSASEAGGSTGASTLVLYPMKCPNRAAERRADVAALLHAGDFGRVVDLTPLEKEGTYFEGTGVLVLDRPRGTAYVAISDRAARSAAERWVDELGYHKLVTFSSVGSDLKPVYHTNVMMAVGTGVAIVCGESVRDGKERQRLFVRASTPLLPCARGLRVCPQFVCVTCWLCLGFKHNCDNGGGRGCRD